MNWPNYQCIINCLLTLEIGDRRQVITQFNFPAGFEGDDPIDWVIIQWHATPDLAEGEVDYFTALLQPLAGEEYMEVIACGKKQFPGF